MKPLRYPLAMAGLAVALAAAAATGRAETGPELFAPGLVSTGFDDSHLFFAPDGNTLYFLRNTPDFMHWTVLTVRRKGNRWETPRIAPFSGRWSDADIFITHDGARLFFISTRPVGGAGKQDTDIWMMTHEGGRWGAPRHVPELASPGYEWFPTLTKAGVVYFGSEREGGLGHSDLWRARWLGDRFSAPENLGPVINTADQEIEPLIAPDESWLVFAARGRKDGAGSYDLYVTFNCPGGWSEPRPLGGGVNSPAWDFAPHLSPDGSRFYFTSNRADTAAEFTDVTDLRSLERRLHAPRNGLRDIYSVDATVLGLDRGCSRGG